MVIDPDHVLAMVLHARREAPNEACGILAMDGDRVMQVFPMTNADCSPVRYSLVPHEQIDVEEEIYDHGWLPGGVFHSHTHTPARPSPTDIRLAFPGLIYVIVSLASREPDVRAYRMDEGVVVEQELVVYPTTV